MSTGPWRWVLEIMQASGELLGTREFLPDFAPAVECARLDNLRRRGPSSGFSYDRPYRVEPCWHPQLLEPYVSELDVIGADGSGDRLRLPIRFFRDAATRAAAEFVELGALRSGEAFAYTVCAYRKESAGPAAPVSRVQVRSARVEPAVKPGEWPGPADLPSPQAGSLRVLISEPVLDEIADHARQRLGSETGGILIGRLRWSDALHDVWAEVTAQIHARGAIGDDKHLQFTPAVWTDVGNALQLRRSDECILGWWHSHQSHIWCAGCPPEKRAGCPLSAGFLSREDRALHRSCFPRAFAVALVVSLTGANEIRHALFTWVRGRLDRSGFYLAGETVHWTPPEAIGTLAADQGETGCEPNS